MCVCAGYHEEDYSTAEPRQGCGACEREGGGSPLGSDAPEDSAQHTPPHPHIPAPHPHPPTDVLTEKAVEFIHDYQEDDRPFFLYLAPCELA